MTVDPTLADRLLMSAAKAFARLPVEEYERAVARLESAADADEFRGALDDLDWGMAPEAKNDVLRLIDEPTWEDARGRLLRALDHQRIERMSPSS